MQKGQWCPFYIYIPLKRKPTNEMNTVLWLQDERTTWVKLYSPCLKKARSSGSGRCAARLLSRSAEPGECAAFTPSIRESIRAVIQTQTLAFSGLGTPAPFPR